jgi:transcriptional regulator with XRE-family HTH domain
MEEVIKGIGERLCGMRDIMNVSVAEMADVTGVSEDDYREVEAGRKDFSFTFLYKAAHRFGIDMTELITGESPHLSGYVLTREGEGLPIERRAGFRYLNLAALFRDRVAEPFMVTAPYNAGAEQAAIVLSTHAGQEMDYIVAGSLRVKVGEHEEIMHAGDTLFYDSGRPHGMVAVGGAPCKFLAIVMNPAQPKQEEP